MKLNTVVNLNRREKYAVSTALAFAILFIIVRFLVFPVMDKREIAQRSLLKKKEVLEDMGVLYAEYLSIRKRSEHTEKQLSRRNQSFTLFSFLDRLAGTTGIKSRIAYMKPTISVQKDGPYRISSVEMKIESVTTGALVDYLYKIESSNEMIRIKRVAMVKDRRNSGLLNVVLHLETFEI